MKSKHNLKTLDGLNPNTTRKLFAKLAEEYDGVSWGRFRTWAGRDLRCFAEDSRWINGDLIRGYFAELDAAVGKRFIALYDAKAHKPSLSAYDAPKRKVKKTTRNGSGGSNGSGGDEMVREAITRALEMNESEALRLKGLLKELQ